MTSSKKIAVLIDGASLYATGKALNLDIDFKSLLEEFRARGNLVRVRYYTMIVEDAEYSTLRPLVDWLDYNGYSVVTKVAKEYADADGRRRLKGNTDIELTVDAMELARHVDEIVLVAGDASFRALVAALQRKGVQVMVMSTMASEPPMLADELRRQTDEFVDFSDLRPKIERGPTRRDERKTRRREPVDRQFPKGGL